MNFLSKRAKFYIQLDNKNQLIWMDFLIQMSNLILKKEIKRGDISVILVQSNQIVIYKNKILRTYFFGATYLQ